jgi:squalene synthase HpnC
MSKGIIDQLDTYGPDHCAELSFAQADAYTQQLAKSHYENFTVVSWFLPKRIRDDFRHVYSFCRWADDLADETGDRARSVELLNWWRRELDACYAGKPRHPVYVALAPTISKHDIPRKPFDDLIDAFIQDQEVTRYNTWDQVLDYCTRSADPVGRLVLYICGYRDEQRQKLSDATCTALQLANFWQDVRRDIIERDRVYVPSEVASRQGMDIDTMVAAVKMDHQQECDKASNASCCNRRLPSIGITAVLPAYQKTIKELVDRTWPLFEEGHGLWPLIAPDVRMDIQLFSRGGESILKLIERQNYDTLTHRPSLGKAAKVMLMMRGLFGKIFNGGPEAQAKTESQVNKSPTGPEEEAA